MRKKKNKNARASSIPLRKLKGEYSKKIRQAERLLSKIKLNIRGLEKLLEEAGSHWNYEDPIYRFYHQSWKVYDLQSLTIEIVKALRSLSPGTRLNDQFLFIIEEGTGKKFSWDHNKRWMEVTRPIVEAFFHARFFLEMACRYGRKMGRPPKLFLPSGWAALLYLYDIR